MFPKLITRKIHAMIDYPVAIALTGLPFILGLGQSNPMALYLSVVTGIAAFFLTILTDHETGIFKVLSYGFHLLVDRLVGITFLAAPFVLGFTGLDMAYYLINAAAVLIVTSLHSPESSAVGA